MAKNTTGSGTTIDGVTVVHPDNMGKSLVFDGMTYNVKVGDTLAVGEDGLVNVKLSPDSGNLLEARANGIGYWAVISEDKNTFFVDAINGNDANSGSREAPIKTINKALSVIAQEDKAGECYIFLKSQQNHRLLEIPTINTKNRLIFITYDEPKYGFGHTLFESNISALYADFKRANIIVERGEDSTGTYANTIAAPRMTFYGVNLHQKFGRGTKPYASIHILVADDDVILWGCDIYQDSDGTAIRASQINLVCSNYFNSGTTGKFTEVNIPPTIFLSESNTLRSSNIRTVKKSEFISPTQYDIATKRQFAFSTSWDFFTNPD